MSQCPNCQKSIDLQEKNFGALFTCPQCQAVYFINFEGLPEYDPNPAVYIPEEPKVAQKVEVNSNNKNSAVNRRSPPESNPSYDLAASEPGADTFLPDPQDPNADDPMNDVQIEPFIENPGQHVSSPFGTTENSNNEPNDYQAPIDFNEPNDLGHFTVDETPGEMPQQEPPKVLKQEMKNSGRASSDRMGGVSERPMTGKSAMRDIVEFANSNETNPAGIEYNLKISGIDSKDLIETVKEALSDNRFLWDLDKLMSEMKNGEMILKRISPVKASLIVSRLRFAELDITWEQNVI